MKLLESHDPDIEVTDKTSFELLNAVSKNPAQGDDPFFVADLGDVISKYYTWVRHLPRVKPFYAIKCCPEPIVVEILNLLGVNFDCASKGEIEAVINHGVSADRIIYANACKTMSHIKYAAKRKVNLMTFDCISELHKIKKCHPEAKTVLRLKVDNKECVSELSLKFGASLKEVPLLLQTAKDLGLNVVGVSFHVGSGCSDLEAFTRAIIDSRWTFLEAEKYGFKLTLLDIGGGFPGDRSSVLFEDVAAVIQKALDKYFPINDEISIIAEPGRYFVSSAFTLCTNVIAKRTTELELNENKPKVFQYYINDGVYGALNCVLFEKRIFEPYSLRRKKMDALHKSVVWGPTCDSADKVVESCYLPEMEIGDWLVFSNVGAYTICAASNFNGFTPPVIHYFISSDYRMILSKIKCQNEFKEYSDCHSKLKSVESSVTSKLVLT